MQPGFGEGNEEVDPAGPGGPNRGGHEAGEAEQ